MVLFLSFGFDFKNFIYFIHGIIFWTLNQNFAVNMPWYYSFSVLFDSLSPILFVFFPFAVIVILFKSLEFSQSALVTGAQERGGIRDTLKKSERFFCAPEIQKISGVSRTAYDACRRLLVLSGERQRHSDHRWFLTRTRNDLLNLFLCLAFLLFASLQARRFPRHFLLAFPFASIIFARALFLLIDNSAIYFKSSRIHDKHFLKKYFWQLFVVFLVISSAGWSVYKIVQYQDSVVLRGAGAFVLSNSQKNATIFIDGVEYWSFNYYTNYERKIVSKLNPSLLSFGDFVVVHKLNKSTPFFIGSPLQNDLTLYTPEYTKKQYVFNEDFYSFVRKYSVLLKSFDYDKLGNKILVYRVGRINAQSQKQVVSKPKFDSPTRIICDIWQSGGVLGRLSKKMLPMQIQEEVSKKCTKGCVYTCDIF